MSSVFNTSSFSNVQQQIKLLKATKVDKSALNQPLGFVGLDSNGKINQSQLPSISISEVYVTATLSERDLLNVQTGDVCKVTDEGKTYIYMMVQIGLNLVVHLML
jgi:hypothetical protein